MICTVLILLPLLGACGVKLFGKRRKRLRDLWVCTVCFAESCAASFLLYSFVLYGECFYRIEGICTLGISFRADGFRCCYVCIAAFMWTMTSLFSGRYFAHYHERTRYYFYYFITLTGVMGLFLSDDLYTAFIFFEIMSLASYPWVAHDSNDHSLRAAGTYLAVAVIGGMVTLMGLFLLYRETGNLSFSALPALRGTPSGYAACCLILFGFLAKAGAFPLHIWLPKAHPVAPAPASALLSGMLTKAGLFGVLVIAFRVFSGNKQFGYILLFIALITMLWGTILGVFSNNLKQILACSSMSQIGYILTGVSVSVLSGNEGALPAQGALLHMLNHSVLKLSLFMGAGAVYMNLHKLNLNEIRGFGRKKPVLNLVFLFGMLGLAGVPGFNGYLSKTMIHEGLAEFIEASGCFSYRIFEWVFLFAAGLTGAYMLKIYIALFILKNKDDSIQAHYDMLSRSYLSGCSRIALLVSTLLIPFIGVLPGLLPSGFCRLSLPFIGFDEFVSISYFSAGNLVSGCISLAIGILVYVFFVRYYIMDKSGNYVDRLNPRFDLEELIYRPILTKILPFLLGTVCVFLASLGDRIAAGFICALKAVCSFVENVPDKAVQVFSECLAFISRVFESVTDGISYLLSQFILTKQTEQSSLGNPVKRTAYSYQKFLHSLKPRLRPDPREVTDLSYGNYFTNTVSFGLLVCTLGIVISFAYVLLHS